MSRVVVINHVTLDGVMQAPGRADEDRRGGFEHGGWASQGSDEVVGTAMGARMAESGGLVFGRRTYEDLLSYWNTQPDSPFTEPLNAARNSLRRGRFASPCRGRTRPSWTAKPPTRLPTSRRSRAGTSISWGAAS
jgi:dihydrofolate reductase